MEIVKKEGRGKKGGEGGKKGGEGGRKGGEGERKEGGGGKEGGEGRGRHPFHPHHFKSHRALKRDLKQKYLLK